MTRSHQPPRRFLLATSQVIFAQGELRQVLVEAQDGFAVLRLKGLKETYPVPWSAVYRLAVAQKLEQEAGVQMARISR